MHGMPTETKTRRAHVSEQLLDELVERLGLKPFRSAFRAGLSCFTISDVAVVAPSREGIERSPGDPEGCPVLAVFVRALRHLVPGVFSSAGEGIVISVRRSFVRRFVEV